MSTKVLISILVCELCVIGTLTHLGAHACALLENQSQPPAGNINKECLHTPVILLPKEMTQHKEHNHNN
eukprot:5499168-Ditylum_brightwellii.AAC.1